MWAFRTQSSWWQRMLMKMIVTDGRMCQSSVSNTFRGTPSWPMWMSSYVDWLLRAMVLLSAWISTVRGQLESLCSSCAWCYTPCSRGGHWCIHVCSSCMVCNLPGVLSLGILIWTRCGVWWHAWRGVVETSWSLLATLSRDRYPAQDGWGVAWWWQQRRV